MQRPEMVKAEFGRWRVAIYEVWVVTIFDEKMMAKWFQQIIKIEPLGAHGWIVWDFGRFWKDVCFYEFLNWQKVIVFLFCFYRSPYSAGGGEGGQIFANSKTHKKVTSFQNLPKSQTIQPWAPNGSILMICWNHLAINFSSEIVTTQTSLIATVTCQTQF